MHRAVYNLAIPNMLNCPLRSGSSLTAALRTSFLVLGFVVGVWAADWNSPEQQLARKVAAVTGPGAVALTVENRSSLGRRETEVISNGLRAALEAAGLRFVKPEQAAATVAISLSENSSSYVWVAEIRQGANEVAVVMVSASRPEGLPVSHESVPLSLRKIPLWVQEERILDVAVLEENPAPEQIAVLDAEKIAIYRLQGGKWQQQQASSITHARPWPRDLRGRLVPAKDHLLDVYLPGVFCRSSAGTTLALTCHESDDPWPLVVGSLSGGGANFPSFGAVGGSPLTITSMRGFFAPTRNFFTGALTPGVGKFTTVAKYYSAAFVPRDKYVLWLFASVDGQVHMVDGVSDVAARLRWGSDLTSVRTSCGAGWQVIATTAGDPDGDAVRAFEFPDRDPVAVSAPVDLAGRITALWTEGKGDSAIAVARSRETGNYEAFRLAIACNQ
ncbi:MAG: hypothetical protein LAO24_01530 [Acidobacteriia bacterium]|nr:hypothetical protein [Terriglobia bacterium]